MFIWCILLGAALAAVRGQDASSETGGGAVSGGFGDGHFGSMAMPGFVQQGYGLLPDNIDNNIMYRYMTRGMGLNPFYSYSMQREHNEDAELGMGASEKGYGDFGKGYWGYGGYGGFEPSPFGYGMSPYGLGGYGGVGSSTYGSPDFFGQEGYNVQPSAYGAQPSAYGAHIPAYGAQLPAYGAPTAPQPSSAYGSSGVGSGSTYVGTAPTYMSPGYCLPPGYGMPLPHHAYQPYMGGFPQQPGAYQQPAYPQHAYQETTPAPVSS